MMTANGLSYIVSIRPLKHDLVHFSGRPVHGNMNMNTQVNNMSFGHRLGKMPLLSIDKVFEYVVTGHLSGVSEQPTVIPLHLVGMYKTRKCESNIIKCESQQCESACESVYKRRNIIMLKCTLMLDVCSPWCMLWPTADEDVSTSLITAEGFKKLEWWGYWTEALCLTISSALWIQYSNVTDDGGGQWRRMTAEVDNDDGGGWLGLWQTTRTAVVADGVK